MNSSEPTPLDRQAKADEQATYTLEPLRAEGANALTTEPSDGITSVKLLQLELLWENAFSKRIIARADDLFLCAAAEGCSGEPIPHGPRLTEATLSFKFSAATDPHNVEIRPPSTIWLQHPEDASSITSFLAKHRFLTSRS
jgi:hypothetical protein